MSKEKITAVKGMNDLLPQDSWLWQYVESALMQIALQYGYQEIRTPMLEKTQLFKQSIGDQTDIVEKEMYTFVDAGKEQITLRPEATASTVRACNQHGLLHNQQQRLWYMGPMFRRERPQRGRYRQFHQFGIEAFGFAGAHLDAEVLLLSARIWQQLGLTDIKLHINTLGSDETRLAYRDALQTYLRRYENDLDEDSQKRLQHNPLRILDSKSETTQAIVANAPRLEEYMTDAAKAHFNELCELLTQHGVDYIVNDRLVRGLDYYTSTVFEWVTDKLGAQATVCGGGRYDNLVATRGGSDTPAVGFAMGLERLIELMQISQSVQPSAVVDAYVIAIDDAQQTTALAISEQLRDASFKVIYHGLSGKLQNQLKRADKSGANIAIIIGEAEQAQNKVQIKQLRKHVEDIELDMAQLQNWFKNDYDNVG